MIHRFKKDLVKYFRELSIVIIGVLITLLITNIISNRIKHNEVLKAIALIHTELEDNLQQIRQAGRKWRKEQKVYSLLRQHINRVENIPADTLETYKNVIGDNHNLSVNNDSYEVLKSSLLIQYITDKDFLRQLSRTYSRVALLKEKIKHYSYMKKNGLEHLINTIDRNSLDKWTNGSIYDFYTISLKNNVFRAFVYNGNTLIAQEEFEECENSIISLIGRIDRQEY